LIAIGIGVATVAGFRALGAGWATAQAIAAVASWFAITACWQLTLRRVRTVQAAEWHTVVIGIVDLTLLTLLLWSALGSWWQGATWHLVIVAACALTLRPRAVIIVTAWAAVMIAALNLGEGYGIVAVPKPPNTPSVVGDPFSALTNTILGILSLVLTVALVWEFARRYARSRERYRQLFDAAPYFIFTITPDGQLRSANPVARMYGAASAEVDPGAAILDRIPAEEHELLRDAVAAAFSGEERVVEHRIRRDDGAERWLRVTYTRAGEPGSRRVLVMGVDVTEERERAAAAAQLQQELDSAGRMRLVGQLVSGVAHELNNPLAAVLNYTELLRAETRPPHDAEALDVVHAQALRARAIVRDLLQVARAPGNRPRELGSLDDLVRRALAPLAARAAESGVLVQLDVRGEVPPQRFDTAGIEQVVTNLVANAIDAAPGGRVRVLVEPMGEGTQLVVEDSGAGIPAQVVPHLFEPFFTTKGAGAGTGLGLAVSRGIVQQHGGSLVAGNGAPGSGVGARFVAHFPERASAGVTTSSGVFPTLDRRGAAAGGRVVLLDDEAAVRLPLVRALTTDGWEVVPFGDGAEALAMLQGPDGATIDVIVSDLKMPGLDGPAFYRALAASHPDRAQRVLFVTGDTASPEMARFLAESGRPVLEKPFPLRELCDKVRAVASRARARTLRAAGS
jgi:two-component system NtrC family sensor kinase